MGTPFDLVFLDPPYAQGLGDTALARLVDGAWVKEDALAVLEERKGVEVTAKGWALLDTLEAGDTVVRFFKRAV